MCVSKVLYCSSFLFFYFWSCYNCAFCIDKERVVYLFLSNFVDFTEFLIFSPFYRIFVFVYPPSGTFYFCRNCTFVLGKGCLLFHRFLLIFLFVRPFEFSCFCWNLFYFHSNNFHNDNFTWKWFIRGFYGFLTLLSNSTFLSPLRWNFFIYKFLYCLLLNFHLFSTALYFSPLKSAPNFPINTVKSAIFITNDSSWS